MPGRLSTELPRWSPDGKALLFTTGASRIYVLDLTEAHARFLAYGHDPEWSPDGSQIAFVRPGREWQVALIQADGSGESPLAFLRDGMRGRLVWEPHGRSILATDGNGRPLRIDAYDGRVTSAGIPAPASALAWSPTGRWVAFAGPAPEKEQPGGVYLFDWGERRASLLATVAVLSFTWSRDGRLLFVIAGDPAGEVLCCDAESGSVLRLQSPAEARPLAPSPTGDEMLYCDTRVPGDLLVGDIHGTRLRPFAHGYNATWSPDGQWVAFFDAPDEEGALCGQRRNGANFARWLPEMPGAPFRERTAETLARGSVFAIYPGLPAVAVAAATHAFLPAAHGSALPVASLAGWFLFFAGYRAGVHRVQDLADSFGERAGHTLSVLPPAALAAVTSAWGLGLCAAWVIPLMALWTAICVYAAPALSRSAPGSRRALAAAWAFSLLGTSLAGALHCSRRSAPSPVPPPAPISIRPAPGTASGRPAPAAPRGRR